VIAAHLVYQTDPEFAVIPAMRPKGCFYLVIVEAISAYFGLAFTHAAAIDFFRAELVNDHPDVDNESFVVSAQNLIDDLVGPGMVEYLGWQPVTRTVRDDEIEWGCWHRAGTKFNHFTHNNGKHVVLYDPWGAQGSESVRLGELISTRIGRLL
jgi:hypothetical protein